MLETDLSLLDDAISLLRKKIAENCKHIGTNIVPEYAMEVGRNAGLSDAIATLEELASGIERDEENG